MFKYIKYIIRAGWYIIGFYPRYLYYLITKNKKTPYEVRYNKTQKTLVKVSKLLHVVYHIEGLENIPEDKGHLFIGNHQSFFDPLSLIINLPDRKLVCVAKKESIKFPIAGQIIYSLDTLLMDRDDLRASVKVIREAANELQKKERDVVIFPEGTRTKNKDKSMNEFKPGSLKTAYFAKATIVPFVFSDSYKVLDIKVKDKRSHVKLSFLKPLTYDDYKDLSTVELAEKLHKMVNDELQRLNEIQYLPVKKKKSLFLK